ncbi:MAG: hypothetical protein QOE83_1996 [Actinomycetota bacterium]|nr:hypothetical protein [Actinomycetota bacterium]
MLGMKGSDGNPALWRWRGGRSVGTDPIEPGAQGHGGRVALAQADHHKQLHLDHVKGRFGGRHAPQISVRRLRSRAEVSDAHRGRTHRMRSRNGEGRTLGGPSRLTVSAQGVSHSSTAFRSRSYSNPAIGKLVDGSTIMNPPQCPSRHERARSL